MASSAFDPLPSVVSVLQAAEVAAQHTPAWFAARLQMFSATDVASIMGCDKYTKRAQTIAKKVQPDTVFHGSLIMEHGTRCEEIVRQLYETQNQEDVAELGLIRHPTLSFIGASPDGIGVTSLHLVEIKCPVSRKLVPGVVPPQYYAQIQTQLQCTQRTMCQYIEADIEEVQAIDASFDGLIRGTYTAAGYKYTYAPRGSSFAEALAFLKSDSRPRDQFWSYRILNWQQIAVPRDDAWWARAVPELASAWAEVEHLRAQPQPPRSPALVQEEITFAGPEHYVE